MEHEKKHKNGFIQFLEDQGILGLAVGLVIGTAAAALVNSLINNVVMPPIAMLMGSAEGMRGLVWNLGPVNGNTGTIYYGQFLNDLINFLVIALVVYLIIKWMFKGKLAAKK